MSHDFPSQAWADAYKEAINTNDAYKVAGKDWTHGAVAMVVTQDAALGIAEDTALWLDVDKGECKSCKMMPAKDAQDAPFVIVAPYARWKEVIKRELDPIKGMMQGKLKLTKGHMPTIVKYVNSSRELVNTTARVDTKFR
ncbi:MAG: SCP2 sterol-binding domain-containing protein, partial [Polyangiaceae bacterium]